MSEHPDRPDPLSLPVFNPGAGTPANGGAADGVRARLSSRPVPRQPDRLPAATPAASVVAERPSAPSADVEWKEVAVYRAQASNRLTQALNNEGAIGQEGERELGRAIIQEVLQDAVNEAASNGRGDDWSDERRSGFAVAIFDAVFRMGRFSPLLDDDRIENIMVMNGCDNVWLEFDDGTIARGPAVADTDEELIEFLAFIASRSEVNARSWTPMKPDLDMRLDDGSRLSASAWVNPRPTVVIRRHRLSRATLGDLVARGTLSPIAASFLAAAIKAKKSVVVAGPQGAGKTTLVRALCAELDRFERVGTFETEYELHLHEMPDRHPMCVPYEARPGSGELDAKGNEVGVYSLDRAIYASFRKNLSRYVVGEVRGPEVWAMIKAMESGFGSLSTTHASDAEAAIRKLVTCAMEAGSHVTRELATSKLAESVDIVVQMHLQTTWVNEDEARRQRWVSEIIAVSPGELAKGYSTTHVFRPRADGPAVAGTLPDDLRALEAHGFDLNGYLAEGGAGATDEVRAA